MKHITGLYKYIYCIKGINKELVKLPLGFIWFMLWQMRYEKLTLHEDRIFMNSLHTPFPSPSYRTALETFRILAERRIRPFSAYLSVTDECPYQCWHCSNAPAKKTIDPSFDELCMIIRQLQEAGVSCIGFTGGEPALREDIPKVIEHVDKRSYTILFTTGYGIDQKKAKDLKEAGLVMIVISLDSEDRDEHNQKRGHDNAFDIALSAIENSIRVGMYTCLSTVISKESLATDTLYRLIKYAGQLGVPEIRLLEPKPCGKLRDGNYDIFTEKERDYIRKIQYRINKDKTLPKIMSFAHFSSVNNYGCSAGRSHLYINSSGEVCPCDFTPLSFGNILNEPLQKIYKRMSRYFSQPSCECLISKISNDIKDIENNSFPLKDCAKIDYLLRGMGKSPIPKLFLKLGYKEIS